VIRCAQSFCEYPYERCIDDHCVDIQADEPDASAGGGGGAGAGGASGGDVDAASEREFGVGGSAGGGGDQDAWIPPEDAFVPAQTPSVLIENPISGSLILDQQPEISGRVRNAEEQIRVRMVLNGEEPGEQVSLNAEGRFSLHPQLPAGQHQLKIIAEQGGMRGEAEVNFRLDFYVHNNFGSLTFNEQPFRFIGLDAPALLEVAYQAHSSGDNAALDEVFSEARALGVTVIRARAHDDRPDLPSALQTARGQYNEEGLLALDLLIARAAHHGIKLILSLIDGGEAYGGIMQYLRWGGYLTPIRDDLRRFFMEGAIRDHFKTHIEALLWRDNHLTGLKYREEPAIMAWELLHGFDGREIFADQTGDDLYAFFEEICRSLKANDPQHLLTTGDMGFDVNPTAYREEAQSLDPSLLDGSHGASWQRNLRLNEVDFASIHLNPQALSFPEDANSYANLGAAWVRSHANLATTNGKALIILSASMHNNLPLEQRRAALSAWFDELMSLRLAGIALGHYYPDSVDPGEDQAAWAWRNGTEPADPGNLYIDLIIEAAAELVEP